MRSSGLLGRLWALARDERGATAIEYGLIGSLMVVVCIAAFDLVGTNMRTSLFSPVEAAVSGATTG